MGGKHLARQAFLVNGRNCYNPVLMAHLKLENKKIRNIANSDITSFVKQSFLYEWIKNSMNKFTNEKIYSVYKPQERVKRIERILRNYYYEKWSCPMDLKDFHEQFGKAHHEMLMRAFKSRL